MTKKPAVHTIVLDWDGTLVPAAWPERPETFMPGAIEACFAMHRGGFHLVVQSARLNPYDPYTSRRRPAGVVEGEAQWMRAMLDSKGLTFVTIWRHEGKAGGSAYIDDKGIRYTGRPGSWKAVTEKVFALLSKEEPSFPVLAPKEVVRSD